eukprot:TRINITY_DN9261_c0_g1_i1.p2 TRINITY_DN9261_c0_g1~~TRINITY_DN9261_c0_g1_i1.p2  ORF type:complete len:103 (+),score=10.03 TRINITY_DN9261_c0_g1_i1:1-309(+)
MVIFFDNSFTGTLPATYSTWTNLVWVNFDTNSLTGTLPAAYTTWTNLKWVDFESNSLTGSIPVEYTNFDQVLAEPQTGNNLCVSEKVLSEIIKGDLKDLPSC